MKYFVAILLSILCISTLSAQSKRTTAEFRTQHKQMISRLLLPQTGDDGALMRTTTGVASQRVIRQWTYDSLGVSVDSVSLRYGPFRGSTYDYNTMIYPYNYPYSNSPMFNYAGQFSKPQVLFDTCMHWTINPYTNTYGNYETTYGTYDSVKCLKAFRDIFIDSATDQNMSFKNTFNAARNITSGYWFNIVSGVADSAFKQYFAYDTGNRIIRDSIYEYHAGSWHIISRTNYTYANTVDLVKIDYYANTMDTTFPTTFPEQAQYTNTFDASHRLSTVFTKFFDGTNLTQFANDTFEYTGAHPFHTAWREYEYDNINAYWAPYFNMIKHLNSAGYPDTVDVKGFDSLANAWVPQTHEVITYNSGNFPDTLKDFEYNFTYFPHSPKFTTVYYYENYTNNTSVNESKTAQNKFQVFPNPTTGLLTIRPIGEFNLGSVTISVYDAQGRVFLRERQPVRGQCAALNIDQLAAGTYWLVLQDDAGTVLHRQAVVRQ